MGKFLKQALRSGSFIPVVRSMTAPHTKESDEELQDVLAADCLVKDGVQQDTSAVGSDKSCLGAGVAGVFLFAPIGHRALGSIVKSRKSVRLRGSVVSANNSWVLLGSESLWGRVYSLWSGACRVAAFHCVICVFCKPCRVYKCAGAVYVPGIYNAGLSPPPVRGGG